MKQRVTIRIHARDEYVEVKKVNDSNHEGEKTMNEPIAILTRFAYGGGDDPKRDTPLSDHRIDMFVRYFISTIDGQTFPDWRVYVLTSSPKRAGTPENARRIRNAINQNSVLPENYTVLAGEESVRAHGHNPGAHPIQLRLDCDDAIAPDALAMLNGLSITRPKVFVTLVPGFYDHENGDLYRRVPPHGTHWTSMMTALVGKPAPSESIYSHGNHSHIAERGLPVYAIADPSSPPAYFILHGDNFSKAKQNLKNCALVEKRHEIPNARLSGGTSAESESSAI